MSKKPLSPKTVTISSFDGGMTDFYIGENDLSKYELAENLSIVESGGEPDLKTRLGSKLHSLDDPVVPTGARVQSIVEIDNKPYLHAERSLYKPTGAGYVDISGGNLFNSDTLAATRSSFATWNRQTYSANRVNSNINKIYIDDTGTTNVETLGLPDFKLFSAISAANTLKSAYQIHIADGAEHIAVDAVNVITEPDATDLPTLIKLVDDIVLAYSGHIIDAKSGTPTYHVATSVAADELTKNFRALSLAGCIELLKEVELRYNLHDADSTAHTTGGTHQVLLGFKPNVTGAAGANTYLYAFHYEYTYSVGDDIFLEQGPVHIIEAGSLDVPNFTISPIEALVNSGDTKYNTAGIKIVISRTQANGDAFFEVSRIDNGVTSYIDSTLDADLTNNPSLYIEGGVLDNHQPPQPKYIEIVNDALVMGDLIEGGAKRPNRVRFSKRLQPHSCPKSFYMDFQDPVTGIGKMNVYPIIFEENRCYRLEGYYNALGQGGYRKREISNRHGCISDSSIINIQEGVLFASSDGFYFTDAFKVYKISDDLNNRFKTLTDKSDIFGTYDKENNIALWATNTEVGVDGNNNIFVAHLNYKKQNGDLAFTVWNGGRLDEGNFSCTSLAYINNQLLRGDRRGYLLRHVESPSTDVVIDAGLAVSQWTTKAILYDFLSISFDFKVSDVRKWVSKIIVNANNEASLSLSIQSSNDNSKVFKDLKPIIEEGNLIWGDPSLIWGDSALRWNYTPTISAWRRFPARSLRCQYKQIRFKNQYREIDDSRSVAFATIDNGAKTITLDDYPTNAWPLKCENYFISFPDDEYVQEFKILSFTGAVMTLYDPDTKLNALVSTEWKIKGYKKGELFSLIDYSLQYDYMTTTQDAFRKILP